MQARKQNNAPPLKYQANFVISAETQAPVVEKVDSAIQ